MIQKVVRKWQILLLIELKIKKLIILRMLNWCQKVDIHLVENHYHYYKQPKTQQTGPKVCERLKAKPIAISSDIRTQIQKDEHKVQKSHASQKNESKNQNSTQQEESILQTRQPYLWSLLNYNSSIQKEHQTVKRNKSDDKSVPQQNKKRKGLQIMRRKQKPVKLLKKQQQIPSMELNLFPNQYSHLEETKFSDTKQTASLEKIKSFHEGTSSHHLNLKKQSQISSYQNICKQSDSFSYSRSASSNKSGAPNVVLKANQYSSQSEALSQLLSHQSISFRVSASYNSPKKHKITLFHDPDRHTIVSKQNQEAELHSERSIKVQESFVCEHQTRKNFEVIRTYMMNKTSQVLQIGKQVNVGCLISIKEISMNQMSEIARQTQIYEMISYQKPYDENLRYLLTLYQVQISKQSYMLIKEPFSSVFTQYMRRLKTKKQREQAIQQLYQNISALLTSLQKVGVYPERLIEKQDIVECFSVLKLHNCSLLRQMEDPIYSIPQILEYLTADFEQKSIIY